MRSGRQEPLPQRPGASAGLQPFWNSRITLEKSSAPWPPRLWAAYRLRARPPRGVLALTAFAFALGSAALRESVGVSFMVAAQGTWRRGCSKFAVRGYPEWGVKPGFEQ